MEARILPRRRGSIATGADLLSDSQLIAIAVIPMITATLSLIGSTCIVYIIIRRKRGDSLPPEVETSSSNGVAVRRKSLQSMQQPKRRMHTYHRLLLAMSVADILNSAWLMLGPLPNIRETGILFASGNTATCAAAGFFFHLGFSVMYYNISLMLYYVMVIRFGIKQQVISRIEPFMHIISIGKPLVEGIIGLSYDAFNPWAYTGCYFAIYPPFCDKGDGKPCTRGRLARLFNLIFTLGPQIAFVATFYVCVAFICSSVNKQARRASRIAINDGPVLRKRAVVTQSILYSLVFVNTHIWFFIAALIGLFAEKVVSLNRVLYKLVVLASIFYPAQVRMINSKEFVYSTGGTILT